MCYLPETRVYICKVNLDQNVKIKLNNHTKMVEHAKNVLPTKKKPVYISAKKNPDQNIKIKLNNHTKIVEPAKIALPTKKKP